MEIYSLVIKQIIILQVIITISAQDLNIVKVGGTNFADVNLFSDMSNVIMGTSGYPSSNENIIYDINGKLNINGSKFITYFSNFSTFNNIPIITNNSTSNNYIVRNYTSQSFFFNNIWITISRNNYVEVYDLTNKKYYSFSINLYFRYDNIIEFGKVFTFYEIGSGYFNFVYFFPFIIKDNNKHFLILSNSDTYTLINDYNVKETHMIREIKGNVISCFSLSILPRIICLFKDSQYFLTAEVYNSTLHKESTTILNKSSENPENENTFFKGIVFDYNSIILAYYISDVSNYLTFSVKTYEIIGYNYALIDYGLNHTISIYSKHFNKNYKLNDLLKLENGDVYFAASSNDRETLYIIIFKINPNYIQKREVTINLFKNYKMKFYKDLKLVNNTDSTIMGFSHCNQENCEESNYHTTSFIIFNDFKPVYDFDLVQSFYESNYNKSNPIIIDLDIYKNNILGLKFKYVEFTNIPNGLTLRIPKNNSQVFTNIIYDFSSFKIELLLNKKGTYKLKYLLTLDDSISGASSSLRRLFSKQKEVTFNIQLNKIITTLCEDKCSLCPTNNPSDCISCKYDYKFIGNKKFCYDSNHEMNNSQIADIYEALKENMEEQNFDIIESENAFLQYAPLELQLKNNPQNISSIDLGECEAKLRKQEHLRDDQQFYIIKIDAKNLSVSATYVQYEIRHPDTFEIVNLEVCSDIKITINTPVKLSEDKFSLISNIENAGYNAFDISDSFYNDVCSSYTAENGADMVLSLRKKEIFDKNKDIYMCQNGCTFQSFDSKIGKAECKCQVQKTNIITDLSKLTFDKTQFFDSFYKTLYNSNFRVLKCVKKLFSSKGFSANFGSYLMTLLTGLFIAFMVLHLLNGQKKVNEILNNIFKLKGGEIEIDIAKELNDEKNEKKEDNTHNEKPEEKKDKDDKKEKKDNKHKHKHKEEKKDRNNNDAIKKENKEEIKVETIDNKENKEEIKENKEEKNKGKSEKDKEKKHGKRKSIKRRSSKGQKNEENDIKINELPAPSKRRKSRKSQSLENNKEKMNEIVFNTKADLVEENNGVKDTDVKEKKHKHHRKQSVKDEIQILELTKGLNDQEMNTLEYEIALIIDKRTYFQYYLSLIKKKHLLLFTFLPSEDYNLFMVKIILFIASFSLYFTINGFFFSDDSMNKIYEDNGDYNIIYQLPQIFYSSIISTVINMLLKLLSLSENKILEIKKENDIEKAKEKAKNFKKELNITLIIFLALSSLLMLFCWYFISCFCAIYENTQLALIGDTLISFAMSMIYPFILNLLPGAFRIPALRAKKKDKKYIYKVSGYVALI